MKREDRRREAVRVNLCPHCPIEKTCPKFDEQVDACADVAPLAELITDIFEEQTDVGIDRTRF